MKVTATRLPEVKLIEPAVYGDARGFFFESYSAPRYAELGIPVAFVQDNFSRSRAGILRGLHLQNPHPQGKLVSALEGQIFDVAVDVRTGSPGYGQWVGVQLDDEGRRQLYVPPGFAHGFYVLSETALVHYKTTDVYDPASEVAVAWDDPALAIEWPLTAGPPQLSDRDRAAPRLADIAPGRLCAYRE